MKKLLLALCLLPSLCFSNTPSLLSQSAIVINDNTQEILLSKNTYVKRPVASITKLMTAIVVLDAKQSLEQPLTVSTANITKRKASSRLPIREKLTRRDLMLLALMSSENRAANTLANNYPKGYSAAIRAMNAKAKQLGMKSTYFKDATGLSRYNVSTSKDLALLVTTAYTYPLIRELTTHKQEVIVLRKREELFKNTNPLIRSADVTDFIHVTKTGYIREAGRCITMVVTTQHNTPVSVVLLNAPSTTARTKDIETVIEWLNDNQI